MKKNRLLFDSGAVNESSLSLEFFTKIIKNLQQYLFNLLISEECPIKIPFIGTLHAKIETNKNKDKTLRS